MDLIDVPSLPAVQATTPPERPRIIGPGRLPTLGATVNFFTPTSARTRSLLGDRWSAFVPGFTPVYGEMAYRFRPDFQVLTRDNDQVGSDNSALLVAFGGQFRKSLVKPYTTRIGSDGTVRVRWRDFAPWVSASVRVQYVELKVPGQNIDAQRVTLGAAISVGSSVTKNAFVAARYLINPDVAGVRLSGTLVEFGVRF